MRQIPRLAAVVAAAIVFKVESLAGIADRKRRHVLQQQAALWSTAAVLSLPSVVSAMTTATTTNTMIADRLEQDLLLQPSMTTQAVSKGVENTYFPEYLAGTWDVTQSLVSVKAPLGLVYLGGPNGDRAIAEKSFSEATQQLNKPVKLELRYLPTKWGVAEDRLFNTRQRLNSFAGRSVVASVDYANVQSSNRPSVRSQGGNEVDPLQTVVVRFRRPAAQKSFVLAHGSQAALDDSVHRWTGYELQRSIFALTNENTAPPITTDTEFVWEFVKHSDSHVKGRLRIAGYLNAQQDKLYFDAKNRAVSLQDYTLDMIRKG